MLLKTEAFFFPTARKPRLHKTKSPENLTELYLAHGMNVAPFTCVQISPSEEVATVKVYLGTTRNDRTPQGVTSAQPPEPLPKKENARQDSRQPEEKREQTQRGRHAGAS
jgi:hypothetical protein